MGLVLVFDPITVLLAKQRRHPRGRAQKLEGLEEGGVRLGFGDKSLTFGGFVVQRVVASLVKLHASRDVLSRPGQAV